MSVWLTPSLARDLLGLAVGTHLEASLDAGRTRVVLRRVPDRIVGPGASLPVAVLEAVARYRPVLVEIEASGATRPLRLVHAGRLYQLVPTGRAPTLMIAGIQMHRLKDAWGDACAKAERVVRTGAWVLDTCGGLGYTAWCLLERGAGMVVSTEPDPAVRELRRHNPWSPPESTDGLVQLWRHAEDLVGELPGSSFDAVLHDPPRFSLAGELYARSFYAALRRVVRRGGLLYHYTGSPYQARRGDRFVRNTAKRLNEAGFQVTWDEDTLGFVGRAL